MREAYASYRNEDATEKDPDQKRASDAALAGLVDRMSTPPDGGALPPEPEERRCKHRITSPRCIEGKSSSATPTVGVLGRSRACLVRLRRAGSAASRRGPLPGPYSEATLSCIDERFEHAIPLLAVPAVARTAFVEHRELQHLRDAEQERRLDRLAFDAGDPEIRIHHDRPVAAFRRSRVSRSACTRTSNPRRTLVS